jgi:hypothetical protein
MGMYRKTRLNFGALANEGQGSRTVDEETRSIMEAQSERLYGETKALLARLTPLTEHLAGKLMDAGEMSLREALRESAASRWPAPASTARWACPAPRSELTSTPAGRAPAQVRRARIPGPAA